MGKVISNIGRGIGKLLGVNTDPPPLPPVPAPVPIVPREAVQPNQSVSASTEAKIRGRQRRSGTIKTGGRTASARGVTTDTEVTYQSLLAKPND